MAALAGPRRRRVELLPLRDQRVLPLAESRQSRQTGSLVLPPAFAISTATRQTLGPAVTVAGPVIEQRDLGEVRTGCHRCARHPVDADLGAAFDDELRAGLGRACRTTSRPGRWLRVVPRRESSARKSSGSTSIRSTLASIIGRLWITFRPYRSLARQRRAAPRLSHVDPRRAPRWPACAPRAAWS